MVSFVSQAVNEGVKKIRIKKKHGGSNIDHQDLVFGKGLYYALQNW